ncbi:anti-phage ZorAB system protein ZorA [Desulfovibrio piger]|uniref:anti-phage ZorAB system protein ZorA n=1 Tax=Desulfovibrio piger TaxID=901 RepID=UPI002430A4AD|nr:anti-phage ZorAB system protein ZorA [Desulfovibrio piger]
MDIFLSWLSKFANRLAEIIIPFFSGMTPDDVTELFKQIILCTALFLILLLVCNASWRWISLWRTKKKIEELVSTTNVSGDPIQETHFPADQRKALIELSPTIKNFSEILREDNGVLYATQDVEAVSHALWEPPLLRSRLIPAGAAILTGLGVLGTFAGLLLGLSGLQLDGNMEHLQAEIRQVAQGASVAFETSVWGVSLSLALTVLEKICSSGVSRRLLSLQGLLLQLFPPFPLPEIMRDTRDSSRETVTHLAGLAEQIGENMQRSLDSFSENMLNSLAGSISEASNRISQAISASLTETLQTTLIPSIDRMSAASQDLATRQAQGSEEALSHLLTEFTGRMGEAGNSQKEAMREATQEMQQAMSTFAESMTGLVRSLQEQQQAFEQRQQNQMERLDTAFRQMNEEQGRNMSKASTDMLEVLATFRDGVREELSRQAADMGKVSDDIRDSLQDMSVTLKEFFTQLGQHQKNQMECLDAAFRKMSEEQGHNMGKASEDMLAVMASFRDGVREELSRQAADMGKVSDDIRDSLQDMSVTLKEFFTQLGQHQKNQMECLDAAFRKMSEEQGHNMGKASEDMLAVMASFRDGVREELTRQATDMGKISDDIHASLREMSTSMKGFFEQMGELQQAQMEQLHTAFHQMNEVQGRNMDKASEGMLAVVDHFRNGMQQELSRQTGDMGKVSENIHGSLQEMSVTMKDFFEQLGQHQQQVSSAQDDRSKVLEKQMQQAFDQQSQTLANMGNAITAHVSATKSLLKQGENLQRRIGEEDALLKNITTAMSSAGDSLQTASTRLHSFGEQIRNSIDRSAQSTERAVAVVQEVGRQENAVALELKHIITGMAPLRTGLENATSSLSSSVSTAREAYTQLSAHYEALQRALRDHMGSMQQQNRQYLAELGQEMQQQVEDLNKKMGELLSEYAKLTKAQLDERMNAWNTQTRNFCDKMQSTAEAMAEVVDAMDNQPRR